MNPISTAIKRLLQVPRQKQSQPPINALPDWFSSNHGLKVQENDKPVALYQSWIPEHTDALVSSLEDPERYALTDIKTLRNVESKQDRVSALRYSAVNPDLFRKMAMHKLSPYRRSAKFLLTTFDWHPFMRHLVYAASQLGIPTVLVPHESVFAKESMFYTHPKLGINTPACDIALVWGNLQEKIFLERGYPADRIIKVGAPKFDYTVGLRGNGDRGAAALLGLDPGKPIVAFAVQPLDSQYDSVSARIAQNNAIVDAIQIATELGAQIIIRTPPSKDAVLNAEVLRLIQQSPNAVLDDATLYLLKPIETIEISDVVLSINSTMLMEAALSGKVAITTKYVEFDQIWDGLKIPVARNRDDLRKHLSRALRSPQGIVAAYDTGWAADAFSVGSFDGQAAHRIRNILADIASGRMDINKGYSSQIPFQPGNAVIDAESDTP